MKLYVGNLDYTVSIDELDKLFSTHGKVEAIKLIAYRRTDSQKGICFVTMESKEAADKALSALNGSDFHGKELIVNSAIEKS